MTITGVTATTKVYDGTTAATLTGGTVSGVINGETVTVIAGTGTFVNANAGNPSVMTTGYALGGANAGNYVLSAQPTASGIITPRPLQLTGTRVYDGTITAAAGVFTMSNNIDGPNLTLTGSISLADRHIGSQALAARVQSATGNTGRYTSSTLSVTLGTTPVSGNSLVAVISTRGTSSSRITSITQTGATWTRASQAANSNGTTTEIWYAPNVSGAGKTITITQASALRSAAVVMEYPGVLAVSPVDQTGNATGSSTAPVTGTTAATVQANELWIGGIGYISSTPTLGSLLNSFSSVANAQTSYSTASYNAKVYALERTVNSIGTASSGGTLSTSAQWSGAIATFKMAMPSTLVLAGSAANNYTLIGAVGSVLVTPRALMVTASSATKTYDGTTTAAGLPTLTPSLAPGDTTSVLSQSFQTSTAGAGNKVIIPSITLNDGNGGANYTVTLVNCNTGTINPATAIITLGSLTPTYDGTAKAATATTTPVNLTVHLTYNGSPTVQTDAGSYAVAATLDEVNYVGSATATLVIAKASATVALDNLTHTYDGTAKVATATTTPVDLTVNLTYDGS
ncbi:MAG: MBG domain-containing protein, partial [Verrucomicrobia bacterium]|nr:MBG domain-containing protein [Verrucomicrobiota bacterium]